MERSTKIGLVLRIIVVVALGIAFGLIGARFVFVGSWLSLIPWGVVCLVIGLSTRSWPATLLLGAVFGVTVVLAFEIFGYQGTGPLTRALPLFVAISFAGGILSTGGAAVGHALRVLASRSRQR